MGGPAIALAVITLAIAPCSRPCSVGGTARDIRPCTDGFKRPSPTQYRPVTAYIIQPWLARPNSSMPADATTSEMISVFVSPNRLTIGRTSAPCENAKSSPTTASDAPTWPTLQL
jgi:hypothetical protein